MIGALAALLLAAPAPARAAGKAYADLKPLIGTWRMDESCPEGKKTYFVTFAETDARVEGRIADASKREVGTFVVDAEAARGRYRTATMMPMPAPLDKFLPSPIEGTIRVSSDPDDPDSKGRDLLSFAWRGAMNLVTASTTMKLRGKGRATFVFKGEAPTGTTACRGSGRRL